MKKTSKCLKNVSHLNLSSINWASAKKVGTWSLLSMVLVVGISLISCSGGGGSSSGDGTISALTLPDRITLSSVEESSNSQAMLHTGP